MITLKDYAKSHGVSYEAVRKQVKRYKLELDGHILVNGRTQYLDEDAQAFLDKKREGNPIIVQTLDRSEELEQLRRDKVNLLIKIAELHEELLREKDQVKLLQNEKIALLEERNTRKSFFSRLFRGGAD